MNKSKSIKSRATSISAKLAIIAREKSVPHEKVLTAFLIERLLVRLTSDDTLKNDLIFKGGYVGLRVYQSQRYTVDLDALVSSPHRMKTIANNVKDLLEKSKFHDGVWFHFEKVEELDTTAKYAGTRIGLRCGVGEPLKELERAKKIYLDFASGDSVFPKPAKIETPYIIGGGNISWSVYPPETIVSEKIHALVTRGDANSRSKDVYDLNHLISKCDDRLLNEAIIKTFGARNSSLPKDIIFTLNNIDTQTLERGWRNVANDLTDKSFSKIFEKVIQKLTEALHS